MNLQTMLNKPSFPKLKPGVHEVIIIDWKVQTSSTDEDYVLVTFAPSAEMRHEHNTALFASEKVNTLGTVISNLQDILNLPGANAVEVLNAAKGIAIPATFEVVTKPERTYYNWYLGWAKLDAAPAAPEVANTEAPAAPERRSRA